MANLRLSSLILVGLRFNAFIERCQEGFALKQSLVAICCKLLRIIFALARKGMTYERTG
ncbi:hypothetical protein [Desulfofundulus sp.]|uniref:hypothetical protein n=1 Tax=Desulfofundulus sp. TaxID=2282750 RepID=UPI003C735111